jgi:hypothetical protein
MQIKDRVSVEAKLSEGKKRCLCPSGSNGIEIGSDQRQGIG